MVDGVVSESTLIDIRPDRQSRRYNGFIGFDPKSVFFPSSSSQPKPSGLTASSSDPKSTPNHLLLLLKPCLILQLLRRRKEKKDRTETGRRLTSEQVERVPGDNLHLCGRTKKAKKDVGIPFLVSFLGLVIEVWVVEKRWVSCSGYG